MKRGVADRVMDTADLRLSELVPDIAWWMQRPDALHVLRVGYLLGYRDAREDPNALGIEADELTAFRSTGSGRCAIARVTGQGRMMLFAGFTPCGLPLARCTRVNLLRAARATYSARPAETSAIASSATATDAPRQSYRPFISTSISCGATSAGASGSADAAWFSTP